jgi:hypothetical protein
MRDLCLSAESMEIASVMVTLSPGDLTPEELELRRHFLVKKGNRILIAIRL